MAAHPEADARLTTHVAHMTRTVQRLAEDVVDYDVGYGVRSRELGLVWSINQLCVTAPADAGRVAALADEHQADLEYRHVVVRDAAVAAAVEPALDAAGWRVERDVVMALEHDAEPGVDERIVAELTEDEMVRLMGEWLREEQPGISDEGVAQVCECNLREGRLFDERRFGVVAEDGTPLSVTKLRVDGSFGWVEDVYTTPSARGNGFARTLVTVAARAATSAGCELITITADADDWPQHLYERCGFRPIGSARIFHRELGEATTTLRR